ncbi:MAG: hypothetical protein HC825_05840 [Oscillatoriales cyanobacterium RM1_1_9]|nr:hypothetical protein [Oscillatoriales cyanobacterium RM1_1_9]
MNSLEPPHGSADETRLNGEPSIIRALPSPASSNLNTGAMPQELIEKVEDVAKIENTSNIANIKNPESSVPLAAEPPSNSDSNLASDSAGNPVGKLQAGNQTQHPVRVVLQRRSGTSAQAEPVHWDFAPQEGRTKGLTLSLPDENLVLASGDILVVFAQDGSRRYWGPYIVDETSLPRWDNSTQTWELTIQP